MPPDDFWGAEVEGRDAPGLYRNTVQPAGAPREGEVEGQGRKGRYGAPGRAEELPVQSLVNIWAGKWTREMEANFRYHPLVMGIVSEVSNRQR